MYPWSLQANLFMGGQCTFAIDLCNTVNQWWRCTGPTNKLRNIPGVLHNILSVLRNVPGVFIHVSLECPEMVTFWPRDLDIWPMTLIF